MKSNLSLSNIFEDLMGSAMVILRMSMMSLSMLVGVFGDDDDGISV